MDSTILIVCSKCNEEKPNGEFRCKGYGAYPAICMLCFRKKRNASAREYSSRPEVRSTRKAYSGNYYMANSQKIKERMRLFRIENIEKIRDRERTFRAENPDKVIASRRKHYAQNKEKIKTDNRKWRSGNQEYVKLYNRKWRLDNSEKVKSDHRRYYIENSERIKERVRIYRVENPEKKSEADRMWRAENPGKVNLYGAKWRANNPEKVLKRGRKWRANNPEKAREYAAKFGGSHFSRAKKRGNHAERFSRVSIFERDGWRCQYCKKKLNPKTAVLEHMIPIAAGGSHTPENCTTSCAKCNGEKAAKLLNGMQITIFDNVKD